MFTQMAAGLWAGEEERKKMLSVMLSRVLIKWILAAKDTWVLEAHRGLSIL